MSSITVNLSEAFGVGTGRLLNTLEKRLSIINSLELVKRAFCET
jgi:hypothetical protein